jgi:enoyl-CoA hydratase/carnithine racemase
MSLAPEVATLDHAAAEVDLYTRIGNAVRQLEADPDVRKVVVSAKGVIVVMDNDYNHVALRMVS